MIADKDFIDLNEGISILYTNKILLLDLKVEVYLTAVGRAPKLK